MPATTHLGQALFKPPSKRADPIKLLEDRGDPFDRAIVEFSSAYADQNESDYRALGDAVRAGRIAAQSGL